MLTNDILEKIDAGEIKSRRQLYRQVGRTKRLRVWLDENCILMPVRWDERRVEAELLRLRKELGRTPRASDNHTITAGAQRVYGSWNNALEAVFQAQNQRRYTDLSDEALLKKIRDFSVRYSRLPMREEFDGQGEWPYYETYLNRFDVRRWAEVISLVDLAGVTLYTQKHGYGNVHYSNGKVYLSRQEKLIGEYLDSQGVEFTQEVPYGGDTNHRFDFFLPEYDLYIEYYGLQTGEYLSRIEEKRSLYGERDVLEIFKHDNTVGVVARKVQRL